MGSTPFILVVTTALVFLIPLAKKERYQEKQSQKEMEAINAPINQNGYRTLKLKFTASSPQEAPIADIIWMKKAADVAIRLGTPYFNVLKQEIRHYFNPKYKMNLPVVKGIIQLENDHMKAKYNSYEIESLILSNSQ
jgi:hypothetical protein